jgi:hypothetical protein
VAGVLAAGPVAQMARLIDDGGRAAAVYTAGDGVSRLALAHDAAPLGPDDWTRYALDYSEGGGPAGLCLSGGQLYVAVSAAGDTRRGGCVVLLPSVP